MSYQLTHRTIVKETLQILQKHAVDLIHVQCISSNGFYALLAKKALKLPLVVTTQGERTMDAAQVYQRSSLMNQNLRELLDYADCVTACSADTLADIANHHGRSFGGPSQVVWNGIRLSDFEGGGSLSGARPYIFAIGRMVHQKAFDILLRAFTQITHLQLDLLIAGDGPELLNLQNLAKELGIADRAHFLGRVDRTAVVSLFKACHFFVLPSRMEPFGIVNLEAMAAGKAVLATRVGGVPEIIADGVNGMLVPPDDVDALAAAMVRLAEDGEFRNRIAAAGRRRSESFDWSAIATQYLDIYERLVGSMSSLAT